MRATSVFLSSLLLVGGGPVRAESTSGEFVRIARVSLSSPAAVLRRLEEVTGKSGVVVRSSAVMETLGKLTRTPGLKGIDLERPIALEVHLRRDALPRSFDQRSRVQETGIALAVPITTADEFRTFLENCGLPGVSVGEAGSVRIARAGTVMELKIDGDVAFGATHPDLARRLDPKRMLQGLGGDTRAMTWQLDWGTFFGELDEKELRQTILARLEERVPEDDLPVLTDIRESVADFVVRIFTDVQLLALGLDLADGGLRIDGVATIRKDSPLSGMLRQMAPRPTGALGATPAESLAGLVLNVNNFSWWRENIGPRLFEQFEAYMRQRRERWVQRFPDQAESTEPEFRAATHYAQLMQRIVREMDRLVISTALASEAESTRIFLSAEMDAAENGARELLDVFFEGYRVAAERGLPSRPVVKIEKEGTHEGYSLISISDMPAPLGGALTRREELDVALAARGGRLLAMVGDDALAELKGAIDELASAANGDSSAKGVELNGLLWIDVPRFLAWMVRTLGEERPELNVIVGMASMAFQKPDQRLSLALRIDEKRVVLRQQVPSGAYALLAQGLNLGLGQLRRASKAADE